MKDDEFRLAMVISHSYWRGTGIVEGALYYMNLAREEEWGAMKEPTDD